ncbi:hypothetical protein BC835DRAFT_818406 [Cytidiella melzeri]|nr:hypothetical protein BC835DRAFT_818406 [Cytidiella melzeri]
MWAKTFVDTKNAKVDASSSSSPLANLHAGSNLDTRHLGRCFVESRSAVLTIFRCFTYVGDKSRDREMRSRQRERSVMADTGKALDCCRHANLDGCRFSRSQLVALQLAVLRSMKGPRMKNTLPKIQVIVTAELLANPDLHDEDAERWHQNWAHLW